MLNMSAKKSYRHGDFSQVLLKLRVLSSSRQRIKSVFPQLPRRFSSYSIVTQLLWDRVCGEISRDLAKGFGSALWKVETAFGLLQQQQNRSVSSYQGWILSL